MAQIIDDRPDTVGREAIVVTRSSPAARIVSTVTSIILAILAIRFVLLLLGANPANLFANAMYSLSYPFVAPFYGLFGYQLQYGVSRFEFETLIAMMVWGLVGYAIARLVGSTRGA